MAAARQKRIAAGFIGMTDEEYILKQHPVIQDILNTVTRRMPLERIRKAECLPSKALRNSLIEMLIKAHVGWETISAVSGADIDYCKRVQKYIPENPRVKVQRWG